MDWMQNPLADMYGPHFLIFYAIVISLVFIFSKIFQYFCDSSQSMEMPQVPAVVDPYEIAFLRGGENEVVRLIIFDLIQRGYLVHSLEFKDDKIRQAKDHPDQRHLNKIEDLVFSHFISSATASEIFKSNLSSGVRSLCNVYQNRLEQEKYIFTQSEYDSIDLVKLFSFLIISILGLYKLIVAFINGHTNVMFLIIMWISACFIYLSFLTPSRMTLRGKKYLQRLQLAYERLVNKSVKLNYRTTDPTLLIMAGIFGVSALTETVYSYYPTMFQKSNNRWYSSSSCGSGCGSVSSCSSSSGSCSGGGGCGGCGGS